MLLIPLKGLLMQGDYVSAGNPASHVFASPPRAEPELLCSASPVPEPQGGAMPLGLGCGWLGGGSEEARICPVRTWEAEGQSWREQGIGSDGRGGAVPTAGLRAAADAGAPEGLHPSRREPWSLCVDQASCQAVSNGHRLLAPAETGQVRL